MTARPNINRMLQRTVAIIAICVCQLSMADEPWTLAKDADGIKVFTRSVANSSFQEFKGEIELEASVNKVVKVLKDADSFQKWMPDLAESKLLSSSEKEQFHYLENAAPWPVSSRDGVYHFTFSHAEDVGSVATMVYVKAVPDYLPRQDGKVRITTCDGFWKIVETTNGVSVTYQAHANPGGTIPGWLVNWTVVDTPFNTLKNLREYLQSQAQ